MQQSQQVLSRALNTLNFKKDITETGAAKGRDAADILGKAQDSLYSSKTGIRRIFGGGDSYREKVFPSSAPDEPETIEFSEPSRQFSSTEDIAARVAQIRRGSMTTFTVNLGGSTGGQVDRDVRRLAGLAPAFIHSGSAATPEPSMPSTVSATCFDIVEVMDAAGAGTGPGDGSEAEGSQHLRAPPSRMSAGGGATPNRGPIRSAFGSVLGAAPFDPYRVSVSGELGGRQSLELADVTRIPSSSSLAAGIEGRPSLSGARRGRPPSLPHAFLGAHGAASAATSPAAGGTTATVSSGGGPTPSLSPVTISASSQLVGQLGFLRDRKALRQSTTDGYSPSSSPGGSNSPGASVAAPAGVVAGANPASILRLPVLPTNHGRALSGPQVGLLTSALSYAPTAPAIDSRPGSSRRLIARGTTSSLTNPFTSVINIPTYPDRRSSVENLDLGFAVANGPGTGVGVGAATSTAGGGGERWFSQDPDDLDMILGGNDEILERLMEESGSAYGSGSGAAAGIDGLGVSLPNRASTGGSFTSGALLEPGLLLPSLAVDSSSSGPTDRATAQLQELWRVQATVGDQLARDRQVLAAGKPRRMSVLEDTAGQHQPRWQVTYNVDAPAAHVKLGLVDASRRSELDRAHLTKLVKEQKVTTGAAPAAGTARMSPVVARARRLSTVLG